MKNMKNWIKKKIEYYQIILDNISDPCEKAEVQKIIDELVNILTIEIIYL